MSTANILHFVGYGWVLSRPKKEVRGTSSTDLVDLTALDMRSEILHKKFHNTNFDTNARNEYISILTITRSKVPPYICYKCN